MCPLHPRYNYTKSLNYCTFYACLAAQSKGLTAPAAQNPRMFSTSEDVSQPTESTQQHSTSVPPLGGDYMSIARDGLSKEHRASSTTSMTSLNNPTHGKYIYINSSSNAGFYCFASPLQLGPLLSPICCNGTVHVIFELLIKCPAPSMLQFTMTRRTSGPIAAGKSIYTI